MTQVRENMLLEIEMLEESPQAEALCRRYPGVQNVEALGPVLRLEYAGDIRAIPALHKQLLDSDVSILFFREMPTELEEVFMKVTKGERA